MPYKVAQVPGDKIPLDGLVTTVDISIRFKTGKRCSFFLDV